MTIDKDKKIIILEKEDNKNSYNAMYDFIYTYFNVDKKDVDVALSIEGTSRDWFWFTKKYMGFFNATSKDLDIITNKYKQNPNIEWIIISFK